MTERLHKPLRVLFQHYYIHLTQVAEHKITQQLMANLLAQQPTGLQMLYQHILTRDPKINQYLNTGTPLVPSLIRISLAADAISVYFC